MSLDNAWNAYIFREGKTAFAGSDLANELSRRLLAFHPQASGSQTELLDLLLRAGELECGLAEANSPDAVVAANLTNGIAEALISKTSLRAHELATILQGITPPEQVQVAPPEGFAYYALHPFDMADLVRTIDRRSGIIAIIGIRSIGTTLSAVVQATLCTDGVRAERITVRPTGHPYDRTTDFAPEQQRWIAAMRAQNSEFFIVDEGPGMSGSSFLSVGEALIDAGIPRSAVSFLCTRCPDPLSLTAPNAAERWANFRVYCTTPTRHLPKGAVEYIAGGIWRAKAFSSEEQWPASWLQMERLKFLSQDGNRLFRFEGFGRFGEDVHNRAKTVAEACFGPLPLAREEGFGVYPMLNGQYLSVCVTNEMTLARIADYCAWRAGAIHSQIESTSQLGTMLHFNVKEEFGIEIPENLAQLPIERPVIADGRMLPHKWIYVGGKLLKLDSATHGDDHFFPGPTDIAWDLAGTIIEWQLNADAANYFLQAYKSRSGDDARKRIPAYLVAYSIFRCAYCKMAAAASVGIPEHYRLVREYQRYRQQAQALVVAKVPARAFAAD